MMYVDGGRTSFENYPIYAGGTAQNRVRIAVGPHGDIYAIWKEGSNVVFSMSSDRGRSWLAVPVTVAQLNGGNDFAIAVDDDDNVYVAIANIYDMNNPTYYWGVKKLIRNGDGTIRFEYHNSESHGTQTISNVNLATGGASGNTYAYMVYRTTDGSGYDTIRGRRSTSWSNEITIVSGTSGVSLSTPSISIYDNKVAVVYNRNSADIVLALDEGSGFVYTTINSGSSTQPGLVFEKDDIYIVWKQNYDIKVCHYRYNLGWSVRVITIVDDGGSTAVDNPAIALDKDGKVIVAWEDSRYSSVYSTDIYFDISSDNASSFSVDERINRDYSGARAQVSVSICSKYGYGPYLAWEDYRSGVWKVYFEDIGLGRPYKIEEIGSIGGVSLPEYRINDIVNYTGIEMKDDTCDYNFGSNIWTVRNPGSSPSVRTESALATIPGTTKALLFGGYNANGYLGDVWIYDHTTTAWSDITPTEKSVTDDTYNDFSGGTFSSTEVQGYSGLDGTVVLSNGISGNRIVSSSVTESGSSLTYDLLWVQSTGTLELTTSSAVCTMNVDTIIVDGLIKADGLSSTPNGNAGGDATSTAGGGGGGGGGYGGAGGRGATSSGGISGGTGGETITGPSTGRAGGNGGLGYCEASRSGGWSGKGGGQININARVVVIGSSGKITANGYNAWSGTGCTGAGGGGGGGGGSGGCIQIKSYDFKSNTGGVLQVKGGNGGNGMGSYYGGGGGGGGGGRIFIYYENMYVMEGSCDISGGTAGSGGSGAQNGGTGVFTSTKQSYTSPFTYSSSGEYVSTAKYLSGGVGAWKNITWSSQVKGTGSLKFQLRTGNTISELESAAFVGPDGTSSSYYTTSGADITNLPKKCYLQYKAYFTRGSTTSDFVALQNITIRYVECIPSPRAGHAMCKVDGDDKVLLFGGNDGSQQFGDTYIYDNSENKWVLGSSSPSARTETAIA
ncbi:MAG: kelch repeat-containing protein, partial [Thermoplasmata archaeon]